MLDPDRLNNADTRRSANATFAVVDALQDNPPHEQVIAGAAFFLLACEHHGVQPQDAFVATKNLMSHAEGRRPEFEGAAHYMKEEWK